MTQAEFAAWAVEQLQGSADAQKIIAQQLVDAFGSASQPARCELARKVKAVFNGGLSVKHRAAFLRLAMQRQDLLKILLSQDAESDPAQTAANTVCGPKPSQQECSAASSGETAPVHARTRRTDRSAVVEDEGKDSGDCRKQQSDESASQGKDEAMTASMVLAIKATIDSMAPSDLIGFSQAFLVAGTFLGEQGGTVSKPEKRASEGQVVGGLLEAVKDALDVMQPEELAFTASAFKTIYPPDESQGEEAALSGANGEASSSASAQTQKLLQLGHELDASEVQQRDEVAVHTSLSPECRSRMLEESVRSEGGGDALLKGLEMFAMMRSYAWVAVMMPLAQLMSVCIHRIFEHGCEFLSSHGCSSMPCSQ